MHILRLFLAIPILLLSYGSHSLFADDNPFQNSLVVVVESSDDRLVIAKAKYSVQLKEFEFKSEGNEPIQAQIFFRHEMGDEHNAEDASAYRSLANAHTHIFPVATFNPNTVQDLPKSEPKTVNQWLHKGEFNATMYLMPLAADPTDLGHAIAVSKKYRFSIADFSDDLTKESEQTRNYATVDEANLSAKVAITQKIVLTEIDLKTDDAFKFEELQTISEVSDWKSVPKGLIQRVVKTFEHSSQELPKKPLPFSQRDEWTEALVVLRNLGSKADAAVPVLKQYLDQSQSLDEHVSLTIGRIATANAAQALIDHLQQRIEKTDDSFENWKLRFPSIADNFAASGAAAVPALNTVEIGKNEVMDYILADAAYHIRKPAAPLHQKLIELLNSPNVEIRFRAALALGAVMNATNMQAIKKAAEVEQTKGRSKHYQAVLEKIISEQ